MTFVQSRASVLPGATITGGLLEQPLHHPADEYGGEAVRGGEFCLNLNKFLLTRILKPAIMQRAGVQFDHPTGAHQNSIEA